MPQPPIQLDYANSPPWHRDPRFRKYARAPAILATVATLLYFVGPPISDRLHLLYYQHRLATHTLLPDFVVYREDGPPLATTAGMTVTRHPGHYLFTSKFRETQNRTSQIEYFPYDIDSFNRHCRNRRPPPLRSVATYFIHTRRAAPGRPPRLIQVTGHPSLRLAPPRTDGYYDAYPVLRATAVQPATLTSNALELTVSTLPQQALSHLPPGNLQLLAGQPDPNDESRFTLEYRTPTTRGTIDGRLLPDDTVQLTLRQALPMTPSAASPPLGSDRNTSGGSSTTPATSPAHPPSPAPTPPSRRVSPE